MVTAEKHGSKRRSTEADIEGWLDRIEVSDLLRVSVHTILNWERRGILHPRKVVRRDNGGAERLHYIYNPKELAKVPRREQLSAVRDPGEITARAFELFDQGKTRKQVIIEIRETADHVEELFDKWLNAGGSFQVITPLAWEAFEKLVGPFTSVVELLEIVAARLVDHAQPQPERSA